MAMERSRIAVIMFKSNSSAEELLLSVEVEVMATRVCHGLATTGRDSLMEPAGFRCLAEAG